MGLSQKISAPSAIAGVGLILVLHALLNTPLIAAQQLVIRRASDEVGFLDSGDARRSSKSKVSANSSPESQPELFFPLTPGTWWLYRGTVSWSDSQTETQ